MFALLASNVLTTVNGSCPSIYAIRQWHTRALRVKHCVIVIEIGVTCSELLISCDPVEIKTVSSGPLLWTCVNGQECSKSLRDQNMRISSTFHHMRVPHQHCNAKIDLVHRVQTQPNIAYINCVKWWMPSKFDFDDGNVCISRPCDGHLCWMTIIGWCGLDY